MAKKPVRQAAVQDNLGGRALVIHTDEDRAPEDKRNGDKFGVTTGLNITHFSNELFYQNYTDMLSDKQLAEILAAEFPNRKTIQRGDWQGAVVAYRGYFNGGQHGHGPYCNAEGGGRPLPQADRLARYKSEEEVAAAQARKDETAKRNADKKAAAKAQKDAEATKKEAAKPKVAAAPPAKAAPARPAAAPPAAKGRAPAAPAGKPAGRSAPAAPARRPAAK